MVQQIRYCWINTEKMTFSQQHLKLFTGEKMQTEKLPENMQKYENQKEQFKRLNRAMDQCFYLEAMFIAYAILEDRTESILRNAEKWDVYVKHLRDNFSLF